MELRDNVTTVQIKMNTNKVVVASVKGRLPNLIELFQKEAQEMAE